MIQESLMEQQEDRLNRRRRRTGIVTSDKMQKTIVVRIGRKFPHAKLGKVIEKFVKFKAHDEKNEAKSGDLVEIEETRPLSRDKRWRLVSVLKKGAIVQKVKEGEAS